MKGTKGHRERKNGASREQWEARKAAANAERPKQFFVARTDAAGNKIQGYWRRSPVF